jgi:hypothetical protein
LPVFPVAAAIGRRFFISMDGTVNQGFQDAKLLASCLINALSSAKSNNAGTWCPAFFVEVAPTSSRNWLKALNDIYLPDLLQARGLCATVVKIKPHLCQNESIKSRS